MRECESGLFDQKAAGDQTEYQVVRGIETVVKILRYPKIPLPAVKNDRAEGDWAEGVHQADYNTENVLDNELIPEAV